MCVHARDSVCGIKPEWPDVGIESRKLFPKIAEKVATAVFT